MRYEVNAWYYIIRYNRFEEKYEIVKRVTGTGKKKLEDMLDYYLHEKYPTDAIFLAKEEKI